MLQYIISNRINLTCMHDNRNWIVSVIRRQYQPRGKYYMKFKDVCKEVSKKTLQLPQGSIKSVDPSKKPRIVYFQYKPSGNGLRTCRQHLDVFKKYANIHANMYACVQTCTHACTTRWLIQLFNNSAKIIESITALCIRASGFYECMHVCMLFQSI